MAVRFPEYKPIISDKDKELIDKVVEALAVGIVTASFFRVFFVQKVVVINQENPP